VTVTAKTIQIFLPSGDPRGLRVAEITTRIVQVIEIPRTRLDEFAAMPESGQVGLYFLFGSTDDGAEQQVYVGQTGDLRARLASHHAKKEFWQRALVVVSRTNSLTQTHALFLEWNCLKRAAEIGRYAIENGNTGSKPHTPAPLEADCLEIFETAGILLSTLGFPLFDHMVRRSGTDQQIFHCRASGTDGRGVMTDDGFVVLKGSVGRRKNVKSVIGTSTERFRARLVESGVVRVDGDLVVFERDHLFNSPSMAAVALVGAHLNGWLVWKTKDDQTLDELHRRKGDA
jgi:predicted GIY-YIG superfamily endonuclease